MFEGIFLARTEDEQHPPPPPAAAKATTEAAEATPPPSTEKAQDGAKQDVGRRSDSWTSRQWPSWQERERERE